MKPMKLFLVALVAVLLTSVPAMAQAPQTSILSGTGIGAGLAAGLTILGAGYGFARIGSSALESMARQPEVAGNIQTGMIIIAALLEGATFFSLIVGIQLVGKATF